MMDPLQEKQQDQLTTMEQFQRPLEDPPVDRLKDSLSRIGAKVILTSEPTEAPDSQQKPNPLRELWEEQAYSLVEKIEEQTEDNNKMQAALVITEISHAYFLEVWEEIGKKKEEELPEYVDNFLAVFGGLDWFLQILQNFPQIGNALIGKELDNTELNPNKEYTDFLSSIKQIQSDLQTFFKLQEDKEKLELTPSAIMSKLSSTTRDFVSTFAWEEVNMRSGSMKLEEKFVEMDRHNRALRAQIAASFKSGKIEEKWFEPDYIGS